MWCDCAFCCLWREDRQRPHTLQQMTGKERGAGDCASTATIASPYYREEWSAWRPQVYQECTAGEPVSLRRFLKKNIPRCGPRRCGQDSRLPPAGGGWRGEPCGRHPPPRLFAIGAAPHLASPRWGEVHTPSTGRKPGDQGAKTRGESFLEITLVPPAVITPRVLSAARSQISQSVLLSCMSRCTLLKMIST